MVVLCLCSMVMLMLNRKFRVMIMMFVLLMVGCLRNLWFMVGYSLLLVSLVRLVQGISRQLRMVSMLVVVNIQNRIQVSFGLYSLQLFFFGIRQQVVFMKLNSSQMISRLVCIMCVMLKGIVGNRKLLIMYCRFMIRLNRICLMKRIRVNMKQGLVIVCEVNFRELLGDIINFFCLVVIGWY